MKKPRILKVPQAYAAKKLGITPQSVTQLLKYKKVERIDSAVSGSSLYVELGRRYTNFGRALLGTEGYCRCGCGDQLLNSKVNFIPGHDRALRSTLQTIYNAGDKMDKTIVTWFVKEHEINDLHFDDEIEFTIEDE